ncbi:MAG: RNA polymerase sigma factor [Clostridia bacterium]|nr:RNA polymerase sigma factor [Clostridia bacterium]
MDTERIARLERLMAAHGTDIIRLCALQLGDMDQAEDAAQDTFVKAWRALPRFKGECSEKTWLFRIAINTCRDYQRTGWFRHMDRRLTPDDLPLAGQGDAPFFRGEITELVLALPGKQKEAVLLRYYQEMPLEEMARVMGISVSTVKRLLKKANEALRRKLKGWMEDE